MDDRKLYFGLVFVLVLSLGAYYSTLDAPFHFDDDHSIVYNPSIRDIRNIPGYLTSLHATSGEDWGRGGYRPVVTASLAVNYWLGGLDPRGYHAFNIAFHLLAVTAVFMLGLLFVRRTGGPPALAILAVGLFGLHPVNTNAVSYIIARSGMLCTIFYLTSFYLYVRYRERGGWPHLTGSLVLFVLALLSKEIAVSLPVVILLYEILVTKERLLKKYSSWAAYFLMAAVFIAARQLMMMHVGGADIVSTKAGHFIAQPWVILNYIRVTLFPAGLNFYPHVQTPVSVFDSHVYVPAAVLGFAVVFVTLIARKNGLYAFLSSWFFVTMLPEIFSNGDDLMVEYRLYLPLVGPALLVALASAPLLRTGARGKAALAGAALATVAMFSVLTYERNKQYLDEVSLWEDVVKKSPGSATAHAYLGAYYLDKNRNVEAARELTAALELDPAMPDAYKKYSNLGMALTLTGKREEAYSAYSKGLSLAPYDVKTLINIGILRLNMGRRDEAAYYIKRACMLQPDDISLQTLLVQVGGADK